MDEQFIEYLVGGKRFTEIKRDVSTNLSEDIRVVYRFDKLIFGLFMIAVLILFVIIFISSGSDRSQHYYYNCVIGDEKIFLNGSASGSCKNPFYHEYPVCENLWMGACDQELVPKGFEFGDPVPLIVKWWVWIVGGLLFIAFVINHFVHNKGFEFGGDAE